MFKQEDSATKDVLILDFGVVTSAAYGADEKSDDITTLGTSRGFVALYGCYSLPLGATVKLLTRGDFLETFQGDATEGTVVWAEISLGDATVEADVVSDNHLLESLFITEGNIEQRSDEVA
jgi:hypothetical protein